MSKPKHGLLPLLTVLFIISYGLLALLVVEQARTIDAQRYLIRSLFSDSTELTTLKGKLFQKERAETQANSHAQAPSTQATPQDRKNNKDSSNKLRKQAPQKPPRPASDLEDVRRALTSI